MDSKCRKCHADIPDGSKYCLNCGAKQDISRKTRTRGNGQGSVYQRPNKSWIAIKVVGWEPLPDGKTRRVTRSKSGFKTKKEALEYLYNMDLSPAERAISLRQLYEAWLPTHRAGKSTMDCYKAAWKWVAPIAAMNVRDITIDDLQECIDDCPHGKRTKQNMKTLCGLLYKYAIPRHIATINMAEYLRVSGESGSKEGLPLSALERICDAVGRVPYADYILAQCYLGFRPSELLALKVSDYNKEERAFTGGSKTDAGRDRIVTVSPKIQPIIDRLTAKSEGAVFCAENGGKMSIATYRDVFYSVLEQCGIENPYVEVANSKRHKYTPHSCRHTFATLLKRAAGADKDKLELIGHTSTEMLRHYQDIDLSDLRNITDSI